MKTSQSFPFYPSDFLLGTVLMTDAQVGAYMRLLCYQWQEGSLPKDENLLARLAATNLETIQAILVKFKEGGDGKLRNKRMEDVRKSLISYRKSRSENGKLGGRGRKAQQKHMLSTSFSDAKHNESLPSPIPSPSPNTNGGDWVEKICKAYPRHDAPMQCMDAIRDALDSGEDPAVMWDQVRECAHHINRAPGGSSNSLIPSAETFFTKRRWKDAGVFKSRVDRMIDAVEQGEKNDEPVRMKL